MYQVWSPSSSVDTVWIQCGACPVVWTVVWTVVWSPSSSVDRQLALDTRDQQPEISWDQGRGRSRQQEQEGGREQREELEGTN